MLHGFMNNSDTRTFETDTMAAKPNLLDSAHTDDLE